MPKYEVGTYEEMEELSKPIPAGTYELEVFSGEEKMSKETNKPMIAWVLKVINNEDPELNGTQLQHNTPLEGKGRMFLHQMYKGCGVSWQGSSVDLPEDLLGRTCFASVNNYVYDKIPRAGIKAILPK